MAVRKVDLSLPDSRKGIAMRDDPTRVYPKRLKLGKSATPHDPRTMLLASYVTSTLPTPPGR